MPQNIYDNEEFFERYSHLPRSVQGFQGAPEWPSLRAMLPDMRGLKVLDLGCGYGWFCRWARQNGAAQVLGIDISEKMLARAAAMTDDSGITYTRADIEVIELPPNSFNLVYSSLAFHYIEDFTRLLTEIRKTLTPGGSLVFSVEHPIYTAPIEPAWTVDGAGRKTWLLNNYLVEGHRTTNWLVKGVVKYHRTVATIINTLLQSGFTMSRIEEWGPTDEQIAGWPELADERQRPTFLLVSAGVAPGHSTTTQTELQTRPFGPA